MKKKLMKERKLNFYIFLYVSFLFRNIEMSAGFETSYLKLSLRTSMHMHTKILHLDKNPFPTATRLTSSTYDCVDLFTMD